jgi:hypothetical protein
MADAAAQATPAASGPPSFSYFAVLSNCPLVAAVLAFAIAQVIKVLTTWYKENRWDAKQLVGSGGMPSSHSATVTALTVAVGLREGFASSLFATAAIFASVVRFAPLCPRPVASCKCPWFRHRSVDLTGSDLPMVRTE